VNRLPLLLLALALGLSLRAPPADAAPPRATGSYPADPTNNIAWSVGTSGVADIQAAFNAGRTAENGQLGASIPLLSMPAQAAWNALSAPDRAAWLINRERIDRGVMRMDGADLRPNSVSQAYAQYLLDRNAFSHTADGHTPGQRLYANAAINACHDSAWSENLFVFATSGNSVALALERAVYGWLYDDSGSAWGHRHNLLYYPYNDNSGQAGQEGLMGIGRAGGGPYQGPFAQPWNYAEIIVFDSFDPCPTWNFNPSHVFLPLIRR